MANIYSTFVLELAFILVFVYEFSYNGKCRGAPTSPRNPCFADSVLPSPKCVSFIARRRNSTWNETLSNFATANQLLKENRFPLYSTSNNGLLNVAVACLAEPNMMPDDGTCVVCGFYCANKMLTEKKFCSLYCPLPPPSPPTRPRWLWRSLATASYFTNTFTDQLKIKSAISYEYKAHQTTLKMSTNNYARALQTGTGKLFNTTRNNHLSRGIETATASPERKETIAKLVNLLNCVRFEIANRIHTDNLLFYKFFLVICVIGCVYVSLRCIGYSLKQCLEDLKAIKDQKNLELRSQT